MKRIGFLSAVVLLAAVLAGAVASADNQVNFSGSVTTDLRFSIEGEPSQFTYNENILSMAIRPRIGDQVSMVGSFNLVNTQFGDQIDINDQQNRAYTDPVRLEVDEAYINVQGLGWTGTDLKVGKQRIQWGTGDQFNPTDNLNPDDLHDPLQFGKKVPSLAIKTDIYAGPITLTGVFEPLFMPVTLPVTDVHGIFAAQFSKMATGFNIDTGNPSTNRIFDALMADSIAKASLGDVGVRSIYPQRTLSNTMGAFKIAGSVSGVDMSASYAYVFDDFGVPKTVYMNIDNPLNISKVDVSVDQAFYRMHVIGADMAANVPFLWDLGFWAEAAYFIPEPFKTQYVLDAGDFNPILEQMVRHSVTNGLVIGQDEPLNQGYVKAVAGVDYTFPGSWYVNAQYVRGLPNDNTADLMENYAIVVLRKPFLHEVINPQLASLYCFGDQSAMIYPEIKFVPMGSLEFYVGALIIFGELDTKIGAYGNDFAYTKVKVSF